MRVDFWLGESCFVNLFAILDNNDSQEDILILTEEWFFNQTSSWTHRQVSISALFLRRPIDQFFFDKGLDHWFPKDHKKNDSTATSSQKF